MRPNYKKMVKMKVLLFTILMCINAYSQQDSIYQNRIDSIDNHVNTAKSRRIEDAIEKMWETKDEYKKGTFRITPYRIVYFTPFQLTDRPNRQPVNFNPNRETPEYKGYQNVEAKFQISLKAKIIQDAFFGKGDLWVGFTQTANWQVYNSDLSRPFREMNYEPELMFTYPLNMSAGDLKFKLIGVSVNHLSNGKEEVLSRSWNRLILNMGISYKDFILMSKFWKRFSEKHAEDDNPHIEDYYGRSEFFLAYMGNYKLIASLMFRNNLSFNKNRSFVELTLGYPIFNDLKLMLQASHGYGSTMIEYNHKQTHASLGFVFIGF